MCGFFGFQRFVVDRNEKINISRKAIELLDSRGPDSNGIELDDNDNLVLSHNRLSILDLSKTGHQLSKTHSTVIRHRPLVIQN